MNKPFEGKVALVTGGAIGIGRAAALAFGRAGATVVLADLAVGAARELVDQLRQSGGQAVFIETDVSQRASVEALIARIVADHGRLDCAYNNAGVLGTQTAMADCEDEQFDRILATNLKGVWLCMKAEIRQMAKQGGGAIVNAASVAAQVGLAGFAAYSASKGGVLQLTRTAALEYAQAGIRINAICPGVINTPMNARLLTDPAIMAKSVAREPVGRLGEPGEVAEAVLWLCSDAASFVTGSALNVDGGWTAQ